MLPEPTSSTPRSQRQRAAQRELVPPSSGWIDSGTTGMSACGRSSRSGTHAPWSRPRSGSSATGRPAAAMRPATSASAGSPGAGYCSSNSARGKPPKSWIVGGCGCAPTCGCRPSQCAEAITMARGVGRSRASSASARRPGPDAGRSSANHGRCTAKAGGTWNPPVAGSGGDQRERRVHLPSPTRNSTTSANAQNAGYSQPPPALAKPKPLAPCTVTMVPSSNGRRPGHPARVDAQQQRSGDHQLGADGEVASTPGRFEKCRRTGRGEYQQLDQRMDQEQHAQGQAQQGGTVRGQRRTGAVVVCMATP